MSRDLASLASSMRSRHHELEAPLAACLDPLKQALDSNDAGSLSSDHSFRESGPIAVYMAEMIAHAQPGALLEYLDWIQGTAAGTSLGSKNLMETIKCFEKVLTATFPEHAQALQDFLKTVRILAERKQQTSEKMTETFVVPDSLADRYLKALLATDRHKAWKLIDEAVQEGMSVKDIYLQVFQKTQYEIGRLWQQNRISVAQEHYCTATTQLIMSRLYPRIFSGEKRGRRVVVACVSGELHELGVRMVADFFEMDGWDSYYAGAGSYESALFKTLEHYEPHVVGLSATLSAHIPRVEKVIKELRRHFGSCPKILVGGRPFNLKADLWYQVGADGYGADASQAVATAESLVTTTP